MRPSRSFLGTIGLGLAVLAISLAKLSDVAHTAFALFLAAVILVELFEESDRERSREPMQWERFRLAAAIQVGALIVLGPWAGALVAAAGVIAVALFRGLPVRSMVFDASATAIAVCAGGLAFGLAGGETGSLRLLDDLIAVVALGLAYLTVRTLLLDVVRRHETFDPRLVASAGEVGLGATLALLAIGHPWNVVLLVPVAIAVQQVQHRLKSLQRETLRALETFANIVDERDPSTYRHSLRVAGYVDGLARALELPYSEIDRLRWAGRLHDLGKVAVDASLLRKQGTLDGAEWAAMRRHPRLSARLLQRFEFVSAQARAVELHHERMDGGGYYGVGGEDLPLASHFLIVADSFDAMTTERPFRPALSHDEALAEIERNSGTQFHPTVAKAFIALERGQDPTAVLAPEELAELRDAAVPYRVPVIPGARDLRDRPELIAIAGVTLALVAAAFHQLELVVAGGAVGVAGLALYVRRRIAVARLTQSVLDAVGHGPDREASFDRLTPVLARACGASWGALIDWEEDGLGGTIAREWGTDGPHLAVLTSWLVREAESGATVLSAGGFELQHDGVLVALPLRRENSALVGFLVLGVPRRLPAHVHLTLTEAADELALTLAHRPEQGQRMIKAVSAVSES